VVFQVIYWFLTDFLFKIQILNENNKYASFPVYHSTFLIYRSIFLIFIFYSLKIVFLNYNQHIVIDI
jgi:hypothetical protein